MPIALSSFGSSPQLRALIDSVEDYAIFLLDPQGIITTWSRGAQRLKGYASAEVVGKSFRTFYTPEDLASGLPDRLIAEASKSGRVESEGWRVRKDGSRFWADAIISALRGDDGELAGFVKVTRDLTDRRGAEERLRQSEERLRLMVDSVKDYAIFMLDPAGNVSTWNTGAQRAKGYSAREIIGTHFSRFYPPENRDKAMKLLEIAAREGRVEDEGWRVRKDGSRFWADVVISRIDDGHGRLLGFTKVTRDLSHRRELEDALRQSEERTRLMLESVTDYAIFMLDPAGNVTTWNPGAERLKGYQAAEIVGRHFSAFYTPEDLAAGKPARELQIATENGRFEEEGIRVRKDGSHFWANVVLSAVRRRDGELIGFTKVTRDMTERRRAAEAMASRVRQQAAVAELGLSAVQSSDLPALFDRAAQAVRTALDVEGVRVVVGAEPAGLFAPAAIHSATEPGRPYGFIGFTEQRSASVVDASFLQSVANVLSAAVARTTVEAQLREAERTAAEERSRSAQAQEALRERDEFISVAAHELRTPLTALQLKLQNLLRAMRGSEREATRLEAAVRQTERMARLVDRLLDVSRIAQGRLEVTRERFDLTALVRQVAEDFRDPAAQVRANIDLQLPETMEGSWDRLRLEQVLVNLLSNAVKYGAGKPISVKVTGDADRVRIEVADRGIGIPQEALGRIFDRFERAASIRHYGGMGLGLYITRHIVEAHGGRVTVSSGPGEGSTFVVDIPRQAGAGRAQASA